MDRLGLDIFSTLRMKGHVLHRAREHLIDSCSSLVWNALLTKKLNIIEWTMLLALIISDYTLVPKRRLYSFRTENNGNRAHKKIMKILGVTLDKELSYKEYSHIRSTKKGLRDDLFFYAKTSALRRIRRFLLHDMKLYKAFIYHI